MRDEEVARTLAADHQLVVVESPAGCGKTYQGAQIAEQVASSSDARILILTHTHAARSVFEQIGTGSNRRIEVKTIDSLVTQIASAYHKALDLPHDAYRWARDQGSEGFEMLAERVTAFLSQNQIVAQAIVDRYPTIVADEHQDANNHQHELLLVLYKFGVKLRMFGDPMQRIYGGFSTKVMKADQERWEGLKGLGIVCELKEPHRWKETQPELGEWILQARSTLRDGGVIDLSGDLPTGLKVIFANNTSNDRRRIVFSKEDRRSIDAFVDSVDELLVLVGDNDMASALRSFWNRRLPIWEGYTRDYLAQLVTSIEEHEGEELEISIAVVDFLCNVAKGFQRASDGERFQQEVRQRCANSVRGKPVHLQDMARCIVDEPSHLGVAKCLKHLRDLRRRNEKGFGALQIDLPTEYEDAVRLGDFIDAQDALSALARKRTYTSPMPPKRAITTIHKAKGLQCDNAIIVPCDGRRFSSSPYARRKLYVGLSRPRKSLAIVVDRESPSPLFRF